MKQWLHDKLGWGFPSELYEQDSFQPTYSCKYCNKKLALDSAMNWFHLTEKF